MPTYGPNGLLVFGEGAEDGAGGGVEDLDDSGVGASGEDASVAPDMAGAGDVVGGEAGYRFEGFEGSG